jgi:hypothetical protein
VSFRDVVYCTYLESGGGGEGRVVLDSALAAAGQDEHAQVHLRERGKVAVGGGV